MVERVCGITGCKDITAVHRMAEAVDEIALRCKTMITDGSCGMRELIAWVQSHDLRKRAGSGQIYGVVLGVRRSGKPGGNLQYLSGAQVRRGISKAEGVKSNECGHRIWRSAGGSKAKKLKITDEELFAGGAFFRLSVGYGGKRRQSGTNGIQLYGASGMRIPMHTLPIRITGRSVSMPPIPSRRVSPRGSFGLTAWWAWPAMKSAISFFTDFQMRDLYASSLKAGRMYPAEPSG